MAVVTLPAAFFAKELDVYGSWRDAFARELVQNSHDAGANRAYATFSDEDGVARIAFADDGHGMTRDVMENVFMALGQTTKGGADTVGGFGRARIILCFAQKRYRIRTGFIEVSGEGGTYTITDVDTFVPGCVFEIDLIDDTTEQIRRAFRAFMRKCDLQMEVYLDGARFSGTETPRRATRRLRDTDGVEWAKVYASDGYGDLRVRVHGLHMFDNYLPDSRDNIILELKPGRSREVLTASRDSLRPDFKKQVEQFSSDLTRNRRAALKPEDKPLDRMVSGGGFLRSDPAVTTQDDTGAGHDDPAGVSNGTVTASVSGFVPGTGFAVPANAAAVANSVWTSDDLPTLFDGLAGQPAIPAAPASTVGFDVALYADANDARVRKLVKQWDPAGWTPTSGQRRRQLLLAWKAVVGAVIDELLATGQVTDSLLWTVGWVFDDAAALHKKNDGGHLLLLNPVDAAGSMRYSLSQRADRQALVANAVHEVTHICVSGHDERFANLMTQLVSRIDFNSLDRVIRDAIRLA
jgi:hypothetical protein